MATDRPTPSLGDLLDDLRASDEEVVVVSPTARLTFAALRERVADLSTVLRSAGVRPGTAVGALVDEGVPALISMFAIWKSGGVYVPINGRDTAAGIATVLGETPVALVVGGVDALGRLPAGVGSVTLDPKTLASTVLRPAVGGHDTLDPDVALVLRTSGTTGRPKAVLLRHSGTLDALDSSLRKLRRNSGQPHAGPIKMNMIPMSLALWAAIYNVAFSLRAGFGVVLLDKFAVGPFVDGVKEFGIRSSVLAPAMIQMLVTSDVTDLGPLRLVRSITSSLSPEVAREFHHKFGVFVLNSYGQTELGGEVVGWTASDVRIFGDAKLGAAGRPYDDVEVRIVGPDGAVLPTGASGEVAVRSPFGMQGYAQGPGPGDPGSDDDRVIDGYLRTGDTGSIDEDGFLWIQGRLSDMINRGGLKVFPDEVEEVLREHPGVIDAAVAGVPDRRLGEIPHAWIVADDPAVVDELDAWCRQRLVPYKVPAGLTLVDSFPRNDIGKLLRRELVATYRPEADPA